MKATLCDVCKRKIEYDDRWYSIKIEYTYHGSRNPLDICGHECLLSWAQKEHEKLGKK